MDLLQTPRRGHKPVTFEGRNIVIRDQDYLHKGNTGLSKGYSFEEFIGSLNGRVFFWPGTVSGPIVSGIRHFERYVEERPRPVILRLDFQLLLTANPGAVPLFCRYNSGSPRCSFGNKSPRGPNTFVTASEFKETASKVVEVTFNHEITLPPRAEYGANPRGPWKKLG